MPPKAEFYRVNAPKVYFSPSDAIAAGYNALPFVELTPEEVLPIAEKAFGMKIAELRDAHLSVCDVLPTWNSSVGDIDQLKIVSTGSFFRAIDAGEYQSALFERDGVFIAIFGTDVTWVVHARPNFEILEQFKNLLAYSKYNAEMIGRSAVFASYFADSVKST